MFKPILLVIGLAILGVVLAACGDDATPTSPPATATTAPTNTPVPPTATPVPPTATPRPTATTVPGEPPPPTFTPTIRPTPTATPAATATPTVPPRPGKLGGTPLGSTNVEITHFGIHECAGSDNTCLAHPAPNYNALIEYNPETDDISDLRCDLCIDWVLDDGGTTYTFNLHPNAVWNNGKPVTAEDVVFSLDRMVDPDKPHVKTRIIAPFYKESRVVDENTVEVETNFPAPAFFSFFASEYMKILSKEHVQSVPDEDMRPFDNIMGSGPFRLIEAERSVKLEYVRNNDYFKEGLPYFDAMTLFFIIDHSALFAAFKSQQVIFTIHSNSGLSNSDALELAEQIKDRARFIFVGPIAPLGIFFNVNRAPFDDPRVRHALWLATHRRPFVLTFSKGVDLLGGPFPPNAWYGIPEDDLVQIPGFRETADGKKHPDDIAMARALLEEAGIGEGFAPVHIYPIIFEHPGITAIFRDQMEEYLGWDIDIRGLDVATWRDQRDAGQYGLTGFGYGIVAHDPHDLLGGVFVQNAASNYSNWTDPRIEDVFLRQARELDRTKRKAIVDEATKIFLEEDSPVIFTYHTVRGHYSALQIQNHHRVGTLSDALKAEHFWCDPSC